MNRSTARRLTRPHPAIGAIGGFLCALSLHLLGVPSDAILHGALTTLFETMPAVGYVAFTVGGLLLAWVSRVFEDRYVYE